MHLASCLIFASVDDVNSVVWYGGRGVRRELERRRKGGDWAKYSNRNRRASLWLGEGETWCV